ncbi:putative hydrolase of the HAD superfamily [Methylohalomonas lacus]|uniref:Hydrolase of the HAD superfamily n=1 Tax=Methylohalomonas lacus TaxID=398773 RepID=A0AAE3L5W3_9GAMM|nr:GMP/IMP nucleotidase [Methylohalomonas lacus]MCS3904152.1 putative hydrolase of the HAD superfamily [Methylohalomonas lacus]
MAFDWSAVDTVLLDMDGTLLDLHFDNYFWQQHLPACWAEQRGMPLAAAHEILVPRFRELEGTLAWYCLDFWSRELELDVLSLKDDLQHLIGLRPHAEIFLEALGRMGKRRILVTNAHPDVLDYKLARTDLARHFEALVSAHALGEPKEAAAFWSRLQQQQPFTPPQTLLIDDNNQVLMTARAFGIAHLLSIAQPDSRQPPRAAADFPAVADFRELLAGADTVAATENEIAH